MTDRSLAEAASMLYGRYSRLAKGRDAKYIGTSQKVETLLKHIYWHRLHLPITGVLVPKDAHEGQVRILPSKTRVPRSEILSCYTSGKWRNLNVDGYFLQKILDNPGGLQPLCPVIDIPVNVLLDFGAFCKKMFSKVSLKLAKKVDRLVLMWQFGRETVKEMDKACASPAEPIEGLSGLSPQWVHESEQIMENKRIAEQNFKILREMGARK